jgi:predicted AAA+ superfamily ATPase
MLTHLEDAFLVRFAPLATSSERQRQVNPRKVYAVDPALIPAFDRSGKANLGHALETAVLLELQRRGCDAGYVFTPGGFEVDFLATDPEGRRTLVQVAADLSEPATREREFRAIKDALTAQVRTQALLLTLTGSDVHAAQTDAPAGVSVRTVWEWMMEA